MSERPDIDKKELLAKNERAWLALTEALEKLNPQQLTGIYDAQGWVVKDHLIHLAAWERSMIYFLQGKPRYEGLGVDETTYLTGGYEAINAVIQQQNRKMSLTEGDGAASNNAPPINRYDRKINGCRTEAALPALFTR
jgi:hypothetical protein